MLIPNLRNQISLIQEITYKRDAGATFLVFRIFGGKRLDAWTEIYEIQKAKINVGILGDVGSKNLSSALSRRLSITEVSKC